MSQASELQVYVRDGIVILAVAKPGCLTMPVAYLSPNQADAWAAIVKEMAETARRRGAVVQQLKAGA